MNKHEREELCERIAIEVQDLPDEIAQTEYDQRVAEIDDSSID